MTTQRTGGMTAIGILNIIFGSFGTLFSIMFVILGGLFAVGGMAMESEMGSEAEGMGAAAAAGGGFIALIGIVSVIFGLMTIFAGIGVLKLAPWGRTLTIVCGFGIVGLNLLGIATGGIGFFSIVSIAWGAILLGFCFSQEWKNTFAASGAAMGAGSIESLNDPMYTETNGLYGLPENEAATTPVDSSDWNQNSETNPMPAANPIPAANDNPMNQASPASKEESGFSSMPGMPPAPPSDQQDQGDQDDQDDISSAA